MFLFQEIPSIQVGFGFAVELFLLIFFFLCWLFYPETPSVSVVNARTDNQVKNESSRDFSKPYLKYVDEIVDNLSLNEARKVASRLKDLEMISPDTKLGGKGIGKDFLIALIKSKVLESRETIASTLTEVLGRTIA